MYLFSPYVRDVGKCYGHISWELWLRYLTAASWSMEYGSSKSHVDAISALLCLWTSLKAADIYICWRNSPPGSSLRCSILFDTKYKKLRASFQRCWEVTARIAFSAASPQFQNVDQTADCIWKVQSSWLGVVYAH